MVFDAQANSLPAPEVTRVVHLAEAARAPGLQVDLGGQAVENALRPSVGISAAVGVIAAAVVLFIAFGSLLAMLLPLAVAIAGLASGLMTVGLASHAVSIASIGPTLGVLIGLGVGIDYALFIVTRHRGNLKAGMTPQDAAASALNSAGRAVLFAGTTVCIALLGMLVLRVGYVSGLGIAAAITVLFTVAAAVTLLPALLGVLGMRVLSRRERRRLAADGPARDGASTWWARLAGFVQRHPLKLAAAATTAMVVLAIPVLSLRLGSSDAGNDPAATTTRQAYDLLADGFGPGFNGPLQLAGTTGTPAATAAFTRLDATLKTEPGIAAVSAPVPGHGASVISVIPATSPEAAATSTLISHLRDSVIPAAEHGTSAARLRRRRHRHQRRLRHRDRRQAAAVHRGHPRARVPAADGGVPQPAHPRGRGGDEPARRRRGLRRAGRRVPVRLGTASAQPRPGRADRVVPARADARRLVRPVHGLRGVPGLPDARGMGATGDNRQAVRTGQATTGRVIIAAATIMICVFSAFILSGQQVIGEFGIGLAAAVVLDAFILRTLLVPALMHLSGRANWWLPGWLDRILPHLSIEPATGPPVRPRDRQRPHPQHAAR